MHRQRQCAALVLASTCLVFIACPGANTNLIEIPQSPELGYEGQAKPGPSRARTSARRADRESPLSRYYNQDYGMSFRYPRNYILEEGNILEHSYFLTRQEDLDLDQSGAELVATILIPEDSYPNTTFLHGSLQLIVKGSSSEPSCVETASPAAGDGHSLPTLLAEGLQFTGFEIASTTADTQVLEHNYAAFSDGACYRFHLVIAVAEPSDNDDLKAADSRKIMNRLEKVVSSLKFEPVDSARGSFAHAEHGTRLEFQPRLIPIRH